MLQSSSYTYEARLVRGLYPSCMQSLPNTRRITLHGYERRRRPFLAILAKGPTTLPAFLSYILFGLYS
jgi:hypothetical protein